jgi:hypothetical protein
MKREPIRKQPIDTLALLKAVAGGSYHPTISSRRKEFDALVRKVAETYGIDDQKALAKAIDFASRMYHDNEILPKEDVKRCKGRLKAGYAQDPRDASLLGTRASGQR